VKAFKIGLSLAVVSLCAGLPASSFAEDDSTRVNLGADFGFAGKLNVDIEDVPDDRDPDSSDLDPSYGFHAGVEVPLHQYFTLGGEFAMAFWNTEDANDDDADRQKQIDVLARPKLRISPIEGLELYGVVPVGFTYYVPGSDLTREQGGVSIKIDGGPGFAVGAAAGATLFFTEHFGLNAELGYLFRKFNAGLDTSSTLGSLSLDAKESFGQLQLRIGASIAF
jgi:hypothetical protein